MMIVYLGFILEGLGTHLGGLGMILALILKALGFIFGASIIMCYSVVKQY